MRVTHDPERVVELVKPFLGCWPMKKTVRGHGKIEVTIYQTLSVTPGEHHAEGGVKVGQVERGIAKSEYCAITRERDSLVQALLDPEQKGDA